MGMQIHRVGYRVRGFVRLHNYTIRWLRMVTDKAKEKARILAFWEKHGIEATTEAFGTKRRTLFLWKSRQKQGNGSLEVLNERSKRPKTVRRREWPTEIVTEIRRLRTEHPNLGKEKVHILLGPFCTARDLPCPSAKTVGRLIADAPDRMRVFPVKVRHDGRIVPRKRQERARKPKGFFATHPGHCGSFDTVERFIHGCRRYVVTFTDVFSRFTFAYATTNHGSMAARECFRLVTTVFPYRLENVLTDNGSEFMKHFDEELRRLHKVHWHTYPRTPKMNAHCERFNRTIQEEFIDHHEPLLLDVEKFNDAMIDWLLWYNGKRPHWSLGLKSPIQFLTVQNPELCNMWWPDTTF